MSRVDARTGRYPFGPLMVFIKPPATWPVYLVEEERTFMPVRLSDSGGGWKGGRASVASVSAPASARQRQFRLLLSGISGTTHRARAAWRDYFNAVLFADP